MFLRKYHWTPREYDEADQDTVDLINALDNATAKHANAQHAQAQREARTAAIRARH
jgi:hypothetical protein